eukprot:Rhum_TRINITY_DN14259_c12_g1::Rhum_TRINITY_DN14259_c12_g1_i1::g.78024::m.78024
MSAAIVARSRTTTPEAATNRPTMSFTSGMSWADDDDLLPRVDPTRAGVIPIAIMDPLRQMTLDMSAIDQRSAGAGETACKGKRGGAGGCTPGSPASPADAESARSRCCKPQQDEAAPATPATPACCRRVPSSSSALSGGGSASEEAASEDASSTVESSGTPPAQPTSPTGTIKFSFDISRLRLGPNGSAPGAARPANLNAILPVSEMRRPVESSRLFNLVPLDMRGGEAATAIAPAPNTEATTPPPTTYGHRARSYAVQPLSFEEMPRALAKRLQGTSAVAEEEEVKTATTTTTNTPDAESDLEMETPLLGNGADTEYDLKYYSSVF